MTRRAARLAALGCAALAACAAPRPHRPLSVVLADAHVHDELDLSGVTHVVKRGETLYRIARAYAIDVADLMETNGIADPRELAVGQELFVPGADRVREVAPAPVPGAPPPGAAAALREPPAPPPRPPPPRAPPPPRSHAELRPSAPPPPRDDAPREDPPPDPALDTPARETGREPPPARPDAAFAWPLKGVLYGRYGVRDRHRHDGIDLAAPEGTRVGAAAAGEVIYVGEQSGYGRIAILRHAGGMVTLYAHMRRTLVDEGAHVERGDAVGEVGQTGRTSGPHLHFEIRDGTRPRNPLLYLP